MGYSIVIPAINKDLMSFYGRFIECLDKYSLHTNMTIKNTGNSTVLEVADWGNSKTLCLMGMEIGVSNLYIRLNVFDSSVDWYINSFGSLIESLTDSLVDYRKVMRAIQIYKLNNV